MDAKLLVVFMAALFGAILVGSSVGVVGFGFMSLAWATAMAKL